MDVKENTKGIAGQHQDDTFLHSAVEGGGAPDWFAPQGDGNVPPGTGAKANSRRTEKNFDDAVDAGVGVPENNIPQGVGEEQTGHQQHHGTHDYGMYIIGDSQRTKAIAAQGCQKGGGDDLKKGVGFQNAEESGQDPQQNGAYPSAQAVCDGAAVEKGKAETDNGLSQQQNGEGKMGLTGCGLRNPFQCLLQRRLFPADFSAQVGEPLHGIQISGTAFNPG